MSRCNQPMTFGEEFICSNCLSDLPFNDLENDISLVTKLQGRIDLVNGWTFLKFTKGGLVQNILHHLKYGNRPDIGITLGEQLGYRLKKRNLVGDIDLIIPVPLHRSKNRIRGYNQSEMFAKGISNILEIPLEPYGLKRVKKGKSQTTKSRLERLESIENTFAVGEKTELQGKHVLLVDDVFTTGATLEACASILFKYEIASLSLATIAEA